MEEKLDKIIEMLEDITIKLEYLEIEIDEIKNGESEESISQKVNLSKYSLEISKLRLEAHKFQGTNINENN